MEGVSKIEDGARSPLPTWGSCSVPGDLISPGLDFKKSGELGSRNLVGSFLRPKMLARNVRRLVREGWRKGSKGIMESARWERGFTTARWRERR